MYQRAINDRPYIHSRKGALQTTIYPAVVPRLRQEPAERALALFSAELLRHDGAVDEIALALQELGLGLFHKLRVLQELHARHEKTILIISHQERIIRLADEIVLISGGRIQSRGPADQLYTKIMADTITGCNKLEVDGKC